MRKFSKISGAQSDVLIVDEAGIEYIMNCIPEGCSVSVIPVRGVIPYVLKPIFFLRLMQRLIQFEDKYFALLSAIIDEINPKVVITFVDNNPKFGNLSSLFPDKTLISVQNGVRSNSHIDIGGWGKGVKVPNYYGFGDYEKDMFTLKEVAIERFRSVGSIRMSSFLSNNHNFKKNNIKKEQVCLLSQFRVGILNSNDKLLCDFHKILKQLHVNLVSWGSKNNIKIVVALFYDQDEEAHKEEIKFYTSGMNECGNVEYSVNDRNKMLSYKLGMESEVVVAMDSTLSYELFGCGCKILFCAGSDKDFLVRWGGVGNLSKMPELVKLHQLNSTYFNDKLDDLFLEDYQNYLKITESARSYYMKCDQKPAHHVIKDDIRKIIDRNENYLVRNKAHV